MENSIDAHAYADIGLPPPHCKEDDDISICSGYTYLCEQHEVPMDYAALTAREREEETVLVRAAQNRIHLYPTRRKAVLPLDKRTTILFKEEIARTNDNNEVVAVEWEVNMIGQAVAVTCRDIVTKNAYQDGTKKVLLTFHLDDGKRRYFDHYLPREWTTRSFVILLALSIEESNKSYVSCAIRDEHKDVNSILTNYGRRMPTADVISLTSESSYNSIVKGGHYCYDTNF